MNQTNRTGAYSNLLPQLLLTLMLKLIRINRRPRKSARTDALRKQDIQLLICSVLRLRQSEVRPERRARGRAGPEEGRLALPVPATISESVTWSVQGEYCDQVETHHSVGFIM